MALDGQVVKKLVQIVNEVYDRDSLKQFMYYIVGVDIYKEWIAPGKPLKTDVFELLIKLEQEGLIVKFLMESINVIEREDMRSQLKQILNSLEVKGGYSTDDQVAAIRISVAGVADNLQTAPLRKIVMQSQGILSELTAKIELLRTYKALHDTLHNANMQFRSLDTSVRQLTTDRLIASDFSLAVMSMETLAACVAGHVQDLPSVPATIRQDELDWLRRFSNAVNTSRQAIDEGNHIAARQGVQGVRSVLRTEPHRINGRLCRTAEEIDLSKLKDVFEAAANLQSITEEEVITLVQGSAATEQILRQVKAQIYQHSSWQDIDRSLSGADDIMRLLTPDEPWDFDALWKNLKESVLTLVNVENQSGWAQKITVIIGRIDDVRSRNDFKNLAVEFARFRQEATVQFYVVDTKFKKLATDVNVIGAPLRNLLNKL